MYRSLVDAYAEASQLVAPQGCVGPESPMTDQPQRPVSGSGAARVFCCATPFRRSRDSGAAQGRGWEKNVEAKKRTV
jgi:hypothetical protein